MIGPKYCLIENKINKIKTTKDKKVLINFGGSNLLLQVKKTISVLEKVLPSHKVYISTASKNYYKILKDNINNAKIIFSLSLSKIINNYKFSFIISSAGHSMYEIIKNNYPSIFVGMVSNQLKSINYLKKKKSAKVILYQKHSFEIQLNKILKQYKKNDKILNIKNKISSVINFNGSEEVAKVLDLRYFKNFHEHLPILQTKRLMLIPLSKKNLFKLYALRNEISNKKMFFKEKNSFSKSVHKKWYKNYYEKKRIDYLIYEKKYRKFIGSLNYKINLNELELGKFIANQSFLGKKYGFESSSEWIKFGINKLGYNRIISTTSKKNVTNINLNKKLGFKKIKDNNNLWQKMVYK